MKKVIDYYFWCTFAVGAVIALESLVAAFIVFFGCLILREVRDVNDWVHGRE